MNRREVLEKELYLYHFDSLVWRSKDLNRYSSLHGRRRANKWYVDRKDRNNKVQ